MRFSEYESIHSVLSWAGIAQWVWVDCFNTYILTEFITKQLRQAGFQICIVSPELQGRPTEIPHYIEHLHINTIDVDAICTKAHYFHEWTTL